MNNRYCGLPSNHEGEHVYSTFGLASNVFGKCFKEEQVDRIKFSDWAEKHFLENQRVQRSALTKRIEDALAMLDEARRILEQIQRSHKGEENETIRGN